MRRVERNGMKPRRAEFSASRASHFRYCSDARISHREAAIINIAVSVAISSQ